MFSKACEYGIRATLFVARNSQEGLRSSLRDIAEGVDSPISFTAKILQQLVRHEILHSVKGVHGGYEFDTDLIDDIALIHIVEAIDGNVLFVGCALGFSDCSQSRPCPVHSQYKSIRKDIKRMLRETTLRKLLVGISEGVAYMKP